MCMYVEKSVLLVYLLLISSFAVSNSVKPQTREELTPWCSSVGAKMVNSSVEKCLDAAVACSKESAKESNMQEAINNFYPCVFKKFNLDFPSQS